MVRVRDRDRDRDRVRYWGGEILRERLSPLPRPFTPDKTRLFHKSFPP